MSSRPVHPVRIANGNVIASNLYRASVDAAGSAYSAKMILSPPLKGLPVIRLQRPVMTSSCVASIGVLVLLIASSNVRAQPAKGKPKILKAPSSTEVKQIDMRLQKLQDNFESESKAIIDGYERSGQFDRAKFLLEVLLKLDPNNEDFKKKVTELEDQLLKTTEFDLKFDAGSDWTPVGTVQKDKLIRVEASGDYKLILSPATLSADGFPSENVMQDLVSRVPTGALMGMIVTEENQKEKQPPEPFAIKAKLEFTPKKEGVLFLKVNVPPGSKCVGDLKLKLSGMTRPS